MHVAKAPLSSSLNMNEGGAISGAYEALWVPGGPQGRSPKLKLLVAPVDSSMVDTSLGANDVVIELKVLPIWVQPSLALMDGKII